MNYGALLLVLVFGILLARLAGRKGYKPGCWFFAAGILGFLVLLCLPSVWDGKSDIDQAKQAARERRGNVIGTTISVLAIFLTLMSVIAAISVS